MNKEAPASVTPIVSCPTCKAQVPWTASSTSRPFCSERCRLIDLGEWASESYKIPEVNPSVGTDEHE